MSEKELEEFAARCEQAARQVRADLESIEKIREEVLEVHRKLTSPEVIFDKQQKKSIKLELLRLSKKAAKKAAKKNQIIAKVKEELGHE